MRKAVPGPTSALVEAFKPGGGPPWDVVPLQSFLYALAAAVAVVLFVALGLVLLAVAAVVALVFLTLGAARLALLRRRSARDGILLFPAGRRRDVGRRRRDPDVIDVVPERD